MNEMVKRVAEGLRAAMPGLVNPEAWPWETMARAAIEAMREPTQAMMDAPTWYDGGQSFTPGDAEAVWEEMIDAALAEPTAQKDAA